MKILDKIKKLESELEKLKALFDDEITVNSPSRVHPYIVLLEPNPRCIRIKDRYGTTGISIKIEDWGFVREAVEGLLDKEE